MRKFAMVMAGAVLALPLAACDLPKDCENLSASAQDREAAANGYEVEREDANGNECQLSQDGSTWSLDD